MGRWTTISLTSLALGALSFAACDTGDGKQLQPIDPADTTSSTVPLDSIPGSGAAVETLPAASDDVAPPPTVADFGPFTLSAPWIDKTPIDTRYTCDGLDLSPALSWSGLPAGTEELAIAMVDESAVSDGQPFIHWVIAGIQPDEITLVEGETPSGATQAINFFGDVGYGGPCPPLGDDAHNYIFTIYALNMPLELADRTPATEFLDVIENAAIGSTDLTGSFQR